MLNGVLRRRPSASMIVALIALIVAMSGTAVAAGHFMVNGNRVIKKHSLSGNRLKNHTITGTQVNLNKLGMVPTANHANSATTATSATTAGSAGEANALGGHPASAFASSSKFHSIEGTILTSGQNSILVASGSVSLVASCATSGSNLVATLTANSAVSNWINDTPGGNNIIARPGTRPSEVTQSSGSTPQTMTQPYSVAAPNGNVITGVETAAADYPSAGECYFTLTAMT